MKWGDQSTCQHFYNMKNSMNKKEWVTESIEVSLLESFEAKIITKPPNLYQRLS